MKISILSDAHLEFGDLDFDNDQGADVLVLGGDILVAADITQHDPYMTLGPEYRSNRFHEFMQRCAARFPQVIYILGNHEHYHGDFATTVQHLKDVFAYLPNVSVLDKETKIIDDVVFIGGTLWTDMNREDPITLSHMRSAMHDFVCVKNSNTAVSFRTYEQFGDIDNREKVIFKTRSGKFTPHDAVEDHKKFLTYIKTVVTEQPDGKFVVCGHHAPSLRSIHPRFAKDYLTNGAYSSDLDNFITNHPQIQLWIHGHTHDEFDYTVGATRVVCNPRGYHNYEQRAQEWTLKTVEI